MRGATVRFRLAGNDRIGVVIEVRTDLIRVAYGTSEPHDDWPQIVVRPETRQGRALVLREVTYFYGANTSWERPRDMQFGKIPCTKELLYAITELVVNYHAQSGGESSASDEPAG